MPFLAISCPYRKLEREASSFKSSRVIRFLTGFIYGHISGTRKSLFWLLSAAHSHKQQTTSANSFSILPSAADFVVCSTEVFSPSHYTKGMPSLYAIYSITSDISGSYHNPTVAPTTQTTVRTHWAGTLHVTPQPHAYCCTERDQ